MSPEAQRIAMAEAVGWKPSETWEKVRTAEHCVYRRGDELRTTKELPDYLNDLNAMHEAEKVLQDRCFYWPNYVDELIKLVSSPTCPSNYSQAICAIAAQRAEAFLRTIGKWEESE